MRAPAALLAMALAAGVLTPTSAAIGGPVSRGRKVYRVRKPADADHTSKSLVRS